MAYRTRTNNATALQYSKFPARENGDGAAAKSKGYNPRSQAIVSNSRAALGTIGNVISNDIAAASKGKKLGRSISLKPSTLLEHVSKRNEKPMYPSPLSMEEMERAFSQQQLNNVEDIDKDDRDNPQLVSEYVNDIYKYMLHLEREMKVNANYMASQEINARMRGILVDWLIQVHLRFHLLQETLFMTISILDRFLQSQSVSRNKLQLVGVTAMFLASKYEEMYGPEIEDFVYITDNAYSKTQIRHMECMMLKTIDYSLGKPLCIHFLRRNSKAGAVDPQTHTLSKYLMELTLQEYDFVQYNPSEIAAAGLCLSIRLLDESATWTDTLVYYSTYTEEHLLPIMYKMCKIVAKVPTSKLQAVKSKYTTSKFMKISLIAELRSTTVAELAAKA